MSVARATGAPGAMSRIWKSVQLFVGFHRDREGNQRAETKSWSPRDGRASICTDPGRQETFLMLESADANAGNDIQIRFQPDKIALSREVDRGWQGVVLGEHEICVRVQDTWIKIKGDGSVTQDIEGAVTHIEADGAVLKTNADLKASMSGDGVVLSRRMSNSVAAITADGVLAKSV